MRSVPFRILLIAGMALSANPVFASCPVPSEGASVDIYPTAQILPSNLLRIYVYFPRPMQADDILGKIHLLNGSGQVVTGAFLPNRFDLWSSDRTRLTVLLDPARVKTGLAAHNAMGRALTEGAQYTVIVLGSAKDAGGCPIGTDTSYAFTGGPPDLTPPMPETWRIDVPAVASRDHLTVDLGDAHDHLSLAYRLRVLDETGSVVSGKITLVNAESAWRFVPRTSWTDQSYRIAIDPRLEDLAGNRPGQLFDSPIGAAVADWKETLEFHPQALDP